MRPATKEAFELIRKELRETEPCFCSASAGDGCPAEALNREVGRLMAESLARALPPYTRE